MNWQLLLDTILNECNKTGWTIYEWKTYLDKYLEKLTGIKEIWLINARHWYVGPMQDMYCSCFATYLSQN